MRRIILAASTILLAAGAYAQFMQSYGTPFNGKGGGSSNPAGGGGGGGGATNPLAAQFIPTLNATTPTGVSAWVTDISSKPFQDQGAAGSTLTFHLAGARNEGVVGQFFVKAPAQGLPSLNIWMSTPTNARTGETISTQTATSPGAFRLYGEGAIFIDTRSVNIAIGPGYVDALRHSMFDPIIPIIDPYYNQKTNEFPMTVAANNNQGFMIGGILPTGISSGYYKFTVNIATGSTLIASLDGAIEVYDSTIPATATALPIYSGYDNTGICLQEYGNGLTGCHAINSTVCGSNDNCGQFIGQHDAAVIGLDHRMQIGNLESLSIAQVDQYFGHLLLGTSSGTVTNTLLPGARLISVREGLQSANNATAAAWMSDFLATYSTTTIMPYDQACDEPGSSWGPCFTAMNGVAASGIATLASANFSQALTAGATGQINVLAHLVEDASANKTNANTWVGVAPSTRSWGQYNDCVSGPCSGSGGTGFPNHHIDGLGINNQVQPWVVVADSATFEFNSDISLCWISGTCGANGTANPWVQGGMLFNQTSHNTTSSDGQGDETWFYPGTTAQIGVTIPVFLSSLRVENHMIGEQAIERKALLKAAGQDAKFWTQLNSFYTNEQTFNEDAVNNGSFTGTIVSAYSNLGCATHQLKWPGGTCGW